MSEREMTLWGELELTFGRDLVQQVLDHSRQAKVLEDKLQEEYGSALLWKVWRAAPVDVARMGKGIGGRLQQFEISAALSLSGNRRLTATEIITRRAFEDLGGGQAETWRRIAKHITQQMAEELLVGPAKGLSQGRSDANP